MSRRKKWWLAGTGIAVLVFIAAVFITASILSRRFEPFIREQAILYLRERFNSDVQMAALRVRVPKTSPFRLLSSKGKGIVAQVTGEGLVMRFEGRTDVPPMFAIRDFSFSVDLGILLSNPKRVSLVTLNGMEIHVPPKGERPTITRDKPDKGSDAPNVIIDEVRITNAKLVLLPKDRKKSPLDFDIHRVRLLTAGLGVPMKYAATLTIPKPPGNVESSGSFGPWASGEPGDTPVAGTYAFNNADLGVFAGIAGILNSTGQFQGNLNSLNVKGQANVPDFRLKMANNKVPLATQFEALVDGTNGNTILQPVRARLGSTDFTTSGGVIKHEGEKRRTISLDASMPNGQLRDVLRLAMKGSPFMEGQIALKTKIEIPPLSGKVRDKLRLDGRFQLSNAKFLRSKIQDQIDSLSRRGQGQPQNEGIDEVVSNMRGVFRLADEVLTFQSLSFGVPGAEVELAGDYNLGADDMDFHGALKLRARVSQTMTGWKRWALKPVDPFFAKQGYGTFLKIKVHGTSREPKFGLDTGGRESEDEEARKK